MSFDITPTAAQHDLARRTHDFAEKCVRPVALEDDQRQEFPWPVLEEAAERGFYSPLFCRNLIGDPTGLSLPMFVTSLAAGYRQLLFTQPALCEGPVQPSGCCVRRVCRPVLDASRIGRRIPRYRDAKLYTIF